MRAHHVQLCMTIFQWLAKRLPRPLSNTRRPLDIQFGFDDRPPARDLAVLLIQHLVTAVPTLAYILVVAQLCGLSPAATQVLLPGTLIGMAISTALNSWGGRLGGGAFFVNMPNFDFLFIAPAAIAAAGAAGLAGVTLVTALTCFLLRPAIPHMRTLLPPAVVGAVIVMAGISFTAPAMRNALGVVEAGALHMDAISALISACTLITIVAISVWGGRRFSVFAVLSGIAVGDLIASYFHRISLPADLAARHWFGAPQPVVPTLHLPLTLILGAVLVSVLGQIYNIGCSVIMDKQSNADWRRPNMQAAGGVLMANGIGDIVGGLAGGIGTNICGANLALASASKSVSRYIGFLVAFFLFGLAFVPNVVTLIIVMLPVPVQGALQVYAALFLISGGIELVAARAASNRTTFLVGISLCCGLTVLMMPALSDAAPASVKLILSSGYLITGIVAFTLNLIFRLGTRQRAALALDPPCRSVTDRITGFLELQGGRWGVRRDVLQRAILATNEAAELIAADSERHLLGISMRCCEFNLDVELVYRGRVIDLSPGESDFAVTAESFMNGAADPVSLDRIMGGVGSAILKRLADKVSSVPMGTATEQACIQLYFEH